MQLTSIKSKISLATCSLLQVTASASQAADSEWDIDAAFLYYGESDGRVQAAEPAIYAGRNFGDDGERIDLRLVIDVLTGATPNGAHAVPSDSNYIQTFTTRHQVVVLIALQRVRRRLIVPSRILVRQSVLTGPCLLAAYQGLNLA